jgi:hypothetical protein
MVIVLVFHVWSTLVFPIMWLDVYLLVVLADSSYMSCAAAMTVYGVTSFLHMRCYLLFQISDYVYQHMCHSYVIFLC